MYTVFIQTKAETIKMSSNFHIYCSHKYVLKRGKKIHKVYHFKSDGKPFIYDVEKHPISLEQLKKEGIDWMVLKHYKEKQVA